MACSDAETEVLHGRQQKPAHRLAPRARVREAAEDERDDDVDHDEIERRARRRSRAARSNSSSARGAQRLDVGDARSARPSARRRDRACGASAPGGRGRCPTAPAGPARAPARRARPIEAARPACAPRPLRRAPAADARPSGPLRPRSVSPDRVVDVWRHQHQHTARADGDRARRPSTAAQSTGPVMPLRDEIVEDPFGGRRRARAGRARGPAPEHDDRPVEEA